MSTLTIRHLTTYRYRQPVAFGEHRMMLRPRDSAEQRVIESRLVIDPEPVSHERRTVYFPGSECSRVRPTAVPRLNPFQDGSRYARLASSPFRYRSKYAVAK